MPQTRLPYPVDVRSRDVAGEPPPAGGGVECFDTPGARAINAARMEHLASLRLPLAGKRVLDVGCGVGHLAAHLVRLGADVVGVDGREENVAHLRAIYPRLTAHVGDAQSTPLTRFGRFDAVLCYGLLYHLEDPVAGLRNVASACGEFLMLETLVCDSARPVSVMVDEPRSFNQALAAVGCRPSPAFVAMALNRVGFAHVYAPATVPDHEDFHIDWRDNLDYARDGHPIRCVFVASRRPLANPTLVPLLT